MLINGRFRVGDVLGAGGMAEVRDGWDTRLGRPVAVKLLHPLLGAQPDMRARFHAEARAAAALNHPNIVSVFDSGEHDGVPFIVMERLPGTSIADEMARGPMTLGRVRSVLDDVLGALGAAHSAGILHRDIKPGNILHATSGGAVKLADFGIAKAMDAATHTRTGQVLGTMAYLSPERIAGAPASVTDDLYAVGVVGYEALTGRPRFSHDNAGALAHAIMTATPPPVSLLRPDTEPELAAVIERAVAPAPRDRFASTADMLTALHGPALQERATPGGPTHTRVLETPLPYQPASLAYVSPPPRRAGRRTKILAGVGAAVVAAVTAVIVVAASQSPMTPTVSVPEREPVTTSSASTTPPPPASTPPPVPAPAPAPAENSNRGNGNGNGNGKKDKKQNDD